MCGGILNFKQFAYYFFALLYGRPCRRLRALYAEQAAHRLQLARRDIVDCGGVALYRLAAEVYKLVAGYPRKSSGFK